MKEMNVPSFQHAPIIRNTERRNFMNIENINIKDLKPYEKNPRNNKEAVDYVAESIKQFGFKVPVVIDKDNVIVCGHTRYRACKKLGITEIPCVIADDLTDEQIKAFRLADNKTAEFAEWDYNLLDEELSDILDLDMSMFGFGDEDDEMEDINDEGNENTTTFEYKLKCGKIDIVLTEDEYTALFDRYQSYLNENGVSFGFITEILKND